jgi:hypothetical protein
VQSPREGAGRASTCSGLVMALAPQPLISKPKGDGNLPKPAKKLARLGGLTFKQYFDLPHHCLDEPEHAGMCCQMGVDHKMSAGLTYVRHEDKEYNKPYWKGTRKKS